MKPQRQKFSGYDCHGSYVDTLMIASLEIFPRMIQKVFDIIESANLESAGKLILSHCTSKRSGPTKIA